MPKKPATASSRGRQLAACREKRQAKENPPAESEAIPEPTSSLPTSDVDTLAQRLGELEPFEHPSSSDLPCTESITEIVEDPGPNPEDLPLEDPPDEETGQARGPEENDDWWDGASNAGDEDDQRPSGSETERQEKPRSQICRFSVNRVGFIM
ncbi:hypothetical protein FRC09_006777 [Ceratobasidium sp. 395]|nr:hypothetical protein FRC09_006777 [Ceratobasidium sp. 395]